MFNSSFIGPNSYFIPYLNKIYIYTIFPKFNCISYFSTFLFYRKLFNLIYKPLSDLFLVYNERRTTTGEVQERAIIAKLTYSFNF